MLPSDSLSEPIRQLLPILGNSMLLLGALEPELERLAIDLTSTVAGAHHLEVGGRRWEVGGGRQEVGGGR